MGLIDVVNGVYLKVTKPFDALGNARFGTKLLRTGTEATARVDGIKTTHSEASSNQWVWILAVTVRPGAADSFRAGFQQNLHGPRDRVHLGAEVIVRHDESRKKVVIDWPKMQERWGIRTSFDTPDGWRPVVKVPEDGVDDWHQKPPKGERATATIAEVGFTPPDVRPSLTLVLPDGRSTQVTRIDVPEYAVYLLAPGNRLPVGVDGDKIRFDWVAAANDAVRNPPRATFDYDSDPRYQRREPAQAVSAAAVAAAMPAPLALDAIEGVSFETYVAIEVHMQQDPVAPAEYDALAQSYGVPPGRWPAVQSGWMARMASDWRVGTRFGEAFEAERKARKKRR